MSRRKKSWIVALALAASLLLSVGGAAAEPLAGAASHRFLEWWQAVLSWALPTYTFGATTTATEPPPPDASTTTDDDGSCTSCTDAGYDIDPNG